jgi:hypothetical protein
MSQDLLAGQDTGLRGRKPKQSWVRVDAILHTKNLLTGRLIVPQ